MKDYTCVICDLCGEVIPISRATWELLLWKAEHGINLLTYCHCANPTFQEGV